jgi:hypothetical protein
MPLHLIGIAHDDGFDGPAKLYNLLRDLRPDLILTEASEREALEMERTFSGVLSELSPFVTDPAKFASLLELYCPRPPLGGYY